jgi:hypothetical protein
LKNNFANWTSGNEVIDNIIQEKNYDEYFIEWIPYDKFIDIKEIGDNCLTTAIWKEGPLHYNIHEEAWMRTPYEKVVLRFLYDFQNIFDELTSEVLNVSTNLIIM